MQGVVLCGGLGTRLRTVIKDLPKPMAPVGDKPFLQILLEYLKTQDISEVVLAVSYKYEAIRDYFGYDFQGLKLKYSIENQPLGTGGGLKKALNLCDDEEIFVFNGDSYFDIALKSLRLMGGAKICLALKMMQDFDRYGSVELEGDLVRSFKEKEFLQKGLINGGVYLLSRRIFEGFDVGESFSFEDFLQENFKDLGARAVVFESYFKDIGLPRDYEDFIRFKAF